METFFGAVALLLLANIAAGLARVVIGPHPADRMSGVLLFGTTAVGMLLVLAEVTGTAAIRDVALVLVVLAATIVMIVSTTRESGTGS